MINCFKEPLHVLMKVLLSTILNADDDDNAHEEVDLVDGHKNWVRDKDDLVDTKEEETQSGGHILKSSLRNVDSNLTETVKKEKKKVQWVDVTGKELAEIREFEASEEDDIDYDRGKSCVCVIL